MKIVFTSHANYRIKKRKINMQEVHNAIKNPDKIIKKYDKYFYQKKLKIGKIEVICEQTENNIKIITVYWI